MNSNKSISRKTKQFQITDISYPAAFHTSQGMYFEDIEGNRVVDFTSGYGVTNIGWQHPKMLEAMQAQIVKSNYCPPWMPTEESANLGEAIKEILERYAGGRDFDVRQCGLMIGVDWNDNPGLSMRFLLKMLKRGLMWCASWDYSTMIALPPLIITRTDSDYALNIFEDTAKEMFPIK